MAQNGWWLPGLLLGLTCLAADLAAEPQIRVELEPAEITIGGLTTATLSLIWDGESLAEEPRFPTWQADWGRAEVVETGAVETLTDTSGRALFQQRVVLTAFSTGEVRLPPLAIVIPVGEGSITLRTPQDLQLAVRSVLPEDEAAIEPRAATPPRPLDLRGWLTPSSTFTGLAALFGLATLAAAIFLLRRPLAITEEHLPKLPPFEELLERLRQIRPQAGAEPAHTRLSHALRGFIGRSLGFPAVESTSTEIQRQLRHSKISLATSQEAVRLLRQCDLVKFADGEATEEQTSERVGMAERLARDIGTALAPPPASDDEDAEAAP